MLCNDFLIAPAGFVRFPGVLEVSRMQKTKAKPKAAGSSATLEVCVQVAAQVLAAW